MACRMAEPSSLQAVHGRALPPLVHVRLAHLRGLESFPANFGGDTLT